MTGSVRDFLNARTALLANGSRTVIFLSTSAVLALGLWLRLYGYFMPSLFVDELWRATVMSASHLLQAMRTLLVPQAIGYMAVSAAVARISDVEWVLKLTSLIPSVLSLVLVFLIARRLFRSNIVRIYLLFVAAVNPTLVEFTKYLKPYVLETFVHLLLIYCMIIYVENKTRRRLLLTLAVSALSGLVAINCIFVLPSIYLILLYVNRADRRSLIMTVGGCLVSLALLLGHYLFIVSTLDLHKVAATWVNTDKNNIDSFYSGGFNIVGYLLWLKTSTIDLLKSAVYTGVLPSFGRSVRRLTEWFCLLGLFFLVKDRNYKLLTLLALPLPLVLIFNFAGRWPYGVSRVNIFLIPYFLLVVGYGMDRLLSAEPGKAAPGHAKKGWTMFRVVLPAFLVFSILVQVPYQEKRIKPGYITQQGRLALEYLCSLRGIFPRESGRPPPRAALSQRVRNARR